MSREARSPSREGMEEQKRITQNEAESLVSEMENMFKKFLSGSTVTDGTVGTSVGDAARGPKRSLFPPRVGGVGGGEKALNVVSVGTQTEEAFSQHLYTAEALETLSSSICRRITNYLDERFMVPTVARNSSTGPEEDFRTSTRSYGNELPSTSRSNFAAMPSFKELSSPIPDIFADNIIPSMPSSLSFDYPSKVLNKENTFTPTERRQKLSEMMHNPINPPFSRSPKSKGVRQSEYETIRRKHHF